VIVEEQDPYGVSPKEPGSKLDSGKPPILRGVLQYFPRAMAAISLVSEAGACKYTWQGWRTVPDGINRYGDAQVRHLVAEVTEGDYDKTTGCLHAAQSAWNSLARLELILEKLADKK
jgi:hypothetical protein